MAFLWEVQACSALQYTVLRLLICLQLVVEWGIGAAVFIRCFVDRRGTENQIVDKLGNGFSTAPFAAVVVLYQLSMD